MSDCPDCGGSGKLIGLFPHYAEGTPPERKRRYIEIRCAFCRGFGYVDQAALDRRERGRQMRAERLERKSTLREESARLGVSASTLSKRERGIVDWDDESGAEDA